MHFLKFAAAGLFSFSITFVVLNVGLWNGLPLYVASVLGYGCGIVSSFLLNKKWTFTRRNFAKKNSRLFAEFVLYNVLMMFAFAHFNVWFAALLPWSVLAQLASFGLSALINFTVYNFILFRHRA
ncbi:GtrA family protein [Candidatus Peregrinibacteria bacterium]|nr:MAG: GtrA family protein [Candidatus Peregrinibacteria bacterium]